MKKFVSVVITFLFVAALVLASCQAATEEEQEGTTIIGDVTETETEEEEEEEAVDEGPEMVRNIHGRLVEKPQYGGTIRYRVLPHQAEHYDPLWWDANNAQSIINDRAVSAPWEMGPEGSNEHPLNYSSYTEDWYRGEMLESFEVIDLYTCLYTLRPGIHFWDKPPVNGRELIVNDWAWGWVRAGMNIQSAHYWGPGDALTYWNTQFGKVDSGEWTESIIEDWLDEMKTYWWDDLVELGYDMTDPSVTKHYTDVVALFESRGYDVTGTPLGGSYPRLVDKYNILFRKLEPDVEVFNDMTSTWALPHEVEDEYGTFDDWQTTVACGPWMPVDYVRDSSATYIRNPNYWQHDPNLPEYQLPYADNLLVLVILDQSTYLAALRTAKIDIGGVVWHQVETFKETSPEMLFTQTPPTQSHTISVRTDIPPFDDVRVRQAAMLAIDQPSMQNEFYEGNAYTYTWPIQAVFPAVYTPPEELPDNIRELYEYHPDKARALLAEAGYPDGFKTKFYIYPSADDRESCLIVSQYLKEVGIECENVIPETASYIQILYGGEYEHMISCWWGNNFPTDTLEWAEGGQPQSPYNFSNVKDVEAEELVDWYYATVDANERNQRLKEFSVRSMELVYNIIIPIPVNHTFWWPWLKNYSGQTDLGYPDETGWGEIPKYLWIDQDLKHDITGR